MVMIIIAAIISLILNMIYIHVYMLYLIYVGETDLMMGQNTLHRGSISAFKIFFAFLFLLFPGFLVLVLRKEMLRRKTNEGIKMTRLEKEEETKKNEGNNRFILLVLFLFLFLRALPFLFLLLLFFFVASPLEGQGPKSLETKETRRQKSKS